MLTTQVRKTYERPALRKLNATQIRTRATKHAREFLELIFPSQAKHSEEGMAQRKKYEKPAIRKLTPEQAKLLLVGYASVGDRGAKDLLELMSSEAGYSMEDRQ